VLDVALWPAEGLYRLVTAARNSAYARGALPVERATIGVISVGNLSVGGAGKTPFAAWLAGRLRRWGHDPAVVLSGYAEDEVKVHRELNPEVEVVAGKRRAHAVAEAGGRRCDVAVVDDGFQHRKLARDVDLVLVSADGWTDRRRLLPRGPWRESIGSLRRADAVVVTRKAVPRQRSQEVARALGKAIPALPTILCTIEPGLLTPLHGGASAPLEFLRGREVLAVAALADARPFERNLLAAGSVVEMMSFPDHHEFTTGDADRIVHSLRDRSLLMTRKDAVKLRSLVPPGIAAYVLEQSVSIEEGEDLLDGLLRKALAR
jgi:tetraacyldisaccharide 4'-kinase